MTQTHRCTIRWAYKLIESGTFTFPLPLVSFPHPSLTTTTTTTTTTTLPAAGPPQLMCHTERKHSV